MFYKFNKETLDFERVNVTKKSLFGFGFAVGLLFVFGFTSNPASNVENLSKEEKLIVIREYNEFSEARLIEQIKSLNFRYPHIVLAQSYQESGHYNSTIFRENNNMFGMKEAVVRSNLAKGTNRGHAMYDTWQECVIDYALYYSTYLSDIKTEGEYFEFLKQNYAEDPTYVTRLKSIIKTRNLKEKF